MHGKGRSGSTGTLGRARPGKECKAGRKQRNKQLFLIGRLPGPFSTSLGFYYNLLSRIDSSQLGCDRITALPRAVKIVTTLFAFLLCTVTLISVTHSDPVVFGFWHRRVAISRSLLARLSFAAPIDSKLASDTVHSPSLVEPLG
ncbi:hypothetical protein CBS63078_5189 [Aspergillus niger]|nr:hypothetical protein CBS115989_9178 [Aspergillus niger]KAI2827856.1 hypothetical protein CBS133816_6117 [Aspergillus niger]KAI2838619.1 hypothetical protein CBS11350_8091 [Aspergillus niger]KAI2841990.1 hypothetical protein CBS11232_8679 [Aspergillus niger]KAI2864042.1 hypothetical protein CBS12448_3323 [Aspergillus niger]